MFASESMATRHIAMVALILPASIFDMVPAPKLEIPLDAAKLALLPATTLETAKATEIVTRAATRIPAEISTSEVTHWFE